MCNKYRIELEKMEIICIYFKRSKLHFINGNSKMALGIFYAGRILMDVILHQPVIAKIVQSSTALSRAKTGLFLTICFYNFY